MAATPDEVWARITTPAGVNHELGPLRRMTWPAEVESLDPADVELDPAQAVLVETAEPQERGVLVVGGGLLRTGAEEQERSHGARVVPGASMLRRS